MNMDFIFLLLFCPFQTTFTGNVKKKKVFGIFQRRVQMLKVLLKICTILLQSFNH